MDLLGFQSLDQPNHSTVIVPEAHTIEANELRQNLVPLLLRPLRLFLTAERLRKVRILLLKITHAPFVALILAYEGGRQFLADQRRAKSSSTRSPGRGDPATSSSLLLRRAVSSRSVHPSLATGSDRQASLATQARTGRSSAPGKTRSDSVAAHETTEALQRLMGEMKLQLHAVEALLEREQARK